MNTGKYSDGPVVVYDSGLPPYVNRFVAYPYVVPESLQTNTHEYWEYDDGLLYGVLGRRFGLSSQGVWEKVIP